jgi:carbonic anhydrase/acetyltransferase-like protein (isoleucine patch superfamily)
MSLVEHGGHQPSVHPTAFVAESATVIGDVVIGEESSIWFNAVIRGDINSIRVGERTNIQDGSILHVTHEHSVRVGSDVTIGHGAIVHGCAIENCSLIGMGATVLDDARVGPYALVAAGSVVRENFVVPEGMLAAGVPARLVRQLSQEERGELKQSAQGYVSYAQSFRK